jgi:hypothetical protein
MWVTLGFPGLLAEAVSTFEQPTVGYLDILRPGISKAQRVARKKALQGRR